MHFIEMLLSDAYCHCIILGSFPSLWIWSRITLWLLLMKSCCHYLFCNRKEFSLALCIVELIASGSNNLNSLHVNLFIIPNGRGHPPPAPAIKHSFALHFVSLILQWALLSTQIHMQIYIQIMNLLTSIVFFLTVGLHTQSHRSSFRVHCRCSRISLMFLAMRT